MARTPARKPKGEDISPTEVGFSSLDDGGAFSSVFMFAQGPSSTNLEQIIQQS